MAKRLYVSAAEPHSGKIVVSLGVMSTLERTIGRLAFFRPVGRPCEIAGEDGPVIDRDVHLIRELYRLDAAPEEMVGATSEEAMSMIAAGRADALHEQILAACARLEERADFVLIEGTDFLSAASAAEDDFNTHVARDLNAPVLLVVDGSSGDLAHLHTKAKVGLDAYRRAGCEVLAVAFNKVPVAGVEAARATLGTRLRGAGVPRVVVLPMEPKLAMTRMDEIAAHLGGEVLFGHRHLHNKVGKTLVASGSIATLIPLLEPGVLLLAHVDRHDVVCMALLSLLSTASPNIAGIVLTGEHPLVEPVMSLVQSLPGPRIPIVTSGQNTFETGVLLSQVRAGLTPRSLRELEIARQLFERAVDTEALMREVEVSTPQQMTPKRFKFELARRARSERKHIVLPEGGDPRILKATDALLRLGVVDLTLLGTPAELRNRAGQLGLDIDGARLVDPQDCPWTEELAVVYHQARRHRGVTLSLAREVVLEGPVFGTLMVHTGRADGMVAGATGSTATTIRPALQVIKMKRGSSIVSSVFFMCLADRVLVYGDCAVVPDPTAAELAEIAIASADTAAAFGIEPRVAMLSYSTGESGSGAGVEKVKEAVRLAKALRPELPLEGPLQYDAAVDASVAASKLPGSEVGGRATVFVFPDLNTGNNTYKAVQRSADAVAVGPVLQGLARPVNDLSRGCRVEDIVNTVAITAIQAQTQGV